MRDDSQRWPAPRQSDAHVLIEGVDIRVDNVSRQMLVSGPNVLAQMDCPLIGWPDIAPAGAYAVCLRRDRVLIVNGAEMVEGWDDAAQQAVSDMTDGYAVLAIHGPRAMDVLYRGTELRLDHPSRSAARMLFGFAVFLYRKDGPDTFRVHVPAAQSDALFARLESAAHQLTHGT